MISLICYVNRILKVIRCLLGSQCKSLRMSVMWEKLGMFLRIRAAVFKTFYITACKYEEGLKVKPAIFNCCAFEIIDART